MVCNNTARAALSKAIEKYTIRHTKNQRQRLDIVADLFKRINTVFDASAEFQAALANASMNHEMWSKFALQLIPNPKGTKNSKNKDKQDAPVSIERAKAKRELLEQCLVNSLGQDIPSGISGCLVRDTLYGARNAVTNYCNFVKQTRDSDGQGQARRFESTLHGSSAQMIQQADEILVQMLAA